MAIQQNFPSTRPSLNLNFARSKKLDPRITFTRTSSATYVGEDGLIKIAPANAARFDHDPITGDSLGLLVEESRTNLILNSGDFGNSTWTKLNSSIDTNITLTPSPDGSNSADKFIADSGSNLTENNSTGAVYSPNISTSSIITFSIFAKSADISSIRIRERVETGCRIIADLNTGTLTYESGNSSQVSSSIQQYPNGWWRIILTRTPTASIGYDLKLGITTGDGTSGIYIWGAQLEAGSFPTSYIPTTASTVTRTADNASMTGTNFSSWFNQSEGAILVEYRSPSTVTTGSRSILAITDGTLANRFQFRSDNATNNTLFSNSSSVLEYVLNWTYNSDTFVRSAIAYQKNNTNSATNGLVGTTDTNDVLPVNLNSLSIGNVINVAHLNGSISRVTYYPTRLPNQILQNLTK